MSLRDNPVLRRCLAAAGGGLARLGPRRPGVVILAYHSIDHSTRTGITVTPARFAEQLDWLAENYSVVSLDDALTDAPASGGGAADRIVLTFDDGYADFRDQALPLLRSRRLPAIVYVITAMAADPARSFDFASGGGKRALSLDDLEQLGRDELVTIGSHTHTHRLLTALDEPGIEDELARSRAILAEALGTSELHFAYPWGVYDRRVEAAARRLFKSAVAGRGGKNLPPFARHRLRRVPVKNEPLKPFQQRVQGLLVLEDLARHWWLRLHSPGPRLGAGPGRRPR